MMVSLGVCLVAIGMGAITLEAAGTTLVCFTLAFLLISYA
jgi:hypothetical protein